ncbi:phosphorylated CTD-interacting factor 1, partial [Caerostris extrusa]
IQENNFLIPAFDHEYRHGFQHVIPRSEIYHRSNYGTLVYFLQNDAGYARWGPTTERIEALLDAFKLGKDKEREQNLLAVATPAMQHGPSNVTSGAQTVTDQKQLDVTPKLEAPHITRNDSEGNLNHSSL